MGSSYHQFCPVAKATELLDQRWTMLIIRELLLGSRHFNDIRRGVPKMSPSLLSKRLHDLIRAGIVERRNDGHEVEYTLTAAGKELQAIVESLGAWGMRWIGRMGDEDLDPKLLMWDLHRHVDAALVPPGRTVVSFRFNDVPAKIGNWWLVITAEEVDVCDFDPGYAVAVSVTGTLRRMVEIWRGDLGWSAAIRSGSIQLEGPERLRRAVPMWFRRRSLPRCLARRSISLHYDAAASPTAAPDGWCDGWRMFASDEGGELAASFRVQLDSALGLGDQFGDCDHVAFGVGKFGNSDALLGSLARWSGDPPADLGSSLQGDIKVLHLEAEAGASFGAAAAGMQRDVRTGNDELAPIRRVDHDLDVKRFGIEPHGARHVGDHEHDVRLVNRCCGHVGQRLTQSSRSLPPSDQRGCAGTQVGGATGRNDQDQQRSWTCPSGRRHRIGQRNACHEVDRVRSREASAEKER